MTETDAGALASAVLRARVAAQIAGVMAARARLVAASGGAADDEAIHDYRVGLRRLRSGLRAIRPVWGKGKLKPLELELKVLADATGDVRDEEVLEETLRGLGLEDSVAEELTRWSVGRSRRLAGARQAAARKLAGSTLGGALAKVLHDVETTLTTPPRRPLSAGELRRRSLGATIDEVVTRAATTPHEDVEGMHTLRIRVKRLRYGIELLCDDDDDAGVALDLGKRLQKRLGELHDLDEAQVRVGRAWGLSPGARAAIRDALQKRRDTAGKKARRDLEAQTPRLREAVERLLAREG